MKQKDLIYLIIAVAILLVAGYVMYANFMPKNTASTSGVQVDLIGSIPSEVDQVGLSQMTDPAKAKDFSSPIEFSGLNNPAPFGK